MKQDLSFTSHICDLSLTFNIFIWPKKPWFWERHMQGKDSTNSRLQTPASWDNLEQHSSHLAQQQATQSADEAETKRRKTQKRITAPSICTFDTDSINQKLMQDIKTEFCGIE